jgi:ABC-type sugar transport system permease subunit
VSLRGYRIGVVLGAAVAAAVCVGWALARDVRARREERLRAAVAAATAWRDGRAVESGLPPGYRAQRLGPQALSASLLDSMRRDEAPRLVRDGALAPLKDRDDWDVIGAVRVTASAAVAAPSLLRASVLLPVALVLAVAAWLLRWGARTGERRRQETLAAWGFLAAPMLHLAVFSLVPVGFTVFLAFHRWDLVSPDKPFVGLDNFRELAADRLFWTTLKNTALYVLYVPITMAAALALALLLNRRRGGERLLRAVVFLPYVTSAVAIALVWQWMFNTDFGFINYGLRLIGLPGVDWLGSPRTALLAIIAVTVWTQVGYQMVVFLAGLQGIPQSYLDAALVDGAGPWQRFRHVTLPLLRPVVLFVLVTGIISGFQVFTLVYMMTEGGPLHSTDVLVYRIYQTAWEFLRFGSASAMAVVLFGILLLATLVQFRLLGRRVEQV